GVLNMDVLVATGAGSAYFYSIAQMFAGGEVYFDTAAMIITLILLGRYIETGAKAKASGAVSRLLSLSPKEARMVISSEQSAERGKGIQPGERKMVPVTEVGVGDMLEVLPGEKIPLDGSVVEGKTEIDESMLTGESLPVSKGAGSDVFCGTQNLYGRILFEVSRTGRDMVLSQIVRAVEEAQARRAPVQRIADRVVGYFVPSVLLLSVLTCIGWIIAEGSAVNAVMHAVTVLVIACPCALGLATPLAILMGTSRGASRGILIKGGDVIERAKGIDTVVLDKTGTLTQGRPELVSCRGIGISDEEALRLAASLEALSGHSIAQAVVGNARAEIPYGVSDFAAVPGKGVVGKIAGKQVMLGSRRFIETEGTFGTVEQAADPALMSSVRAQETSGATVVYLSCDGQLAGILAVADQARSESAQALSTLKHMGHDIIMITGDSRAAADSVAEAVGLDSGKVMAEKSPVEKAEAIRNMQIVGKAVMMAGDGINDAPALVQADVGLAMGRATDIALESADMVLMRNDLRLVPEAVALAKKTYGVIRQNLMWAFVYNVTALPLAVAGMLHPIIAALAMTLSSLSVVGNSLRLRRG
ncbi:MAG: copper-translocating P-type ATPase, partial [Nitrospiraceae bacterium]